MPHEAYNVCLQAYIKHTSTKHTSSIHQAYRVYASQAYIITVPPLIFGLSVVSVRVGVKARLVLVLRLDVGFVWVVHVGLLGDCSE